jgi:hypoxanthine-DNA glycosylase
MKICSFAHISDSNSRVLILGTMPGEKSLKLNQYYGHAGNVFWKLIFNIYNEPISNDYDKRKAILLKNKIALWDVLKGCEREGSADSAIVKEEVNDFENFFEDHLEIKLIAFNGKNAEDYYNQFYPDKPNIQTICLPSTSPANTWKSFEEKLGVWKQIVEK